MKQLTTLMAVLAAFVLCFGTTAFAELNIGGDIKVLGVYTDNVTDFQDDENGAVRDDNNDFLRVETHLFFTADLSDNVTTKVSIEADRDFDYSVERSLDSSSSYYDDDYYNGYGKRVIPSDSSSSFGDLNVFLEEAWIQIAYIYDSAFSAKLGRQFVQFGDGFVVGDSQVFNPLFLSDLGEYEVDPFDAVLVWYDGDDWILNMLAAKTVETRALDQDADLYALYFTYSGIEDHAIDVYLTFNHFQNTPVGWFDNSFSLMSDSVDAEVYTLGARAAGSAAEGLTYKLEGLYQFGDIQVGRNTREMDVRAWALEGGLKYVFDTDYNPYLGFTYVYMSGDDDSDRKWENYLGLFANRTYGEIFDPWTNLGNMHIFNLSGGLDLSDDVSLGAKYYFFMAAKDRDWGKDSDLGQEVDAYLDYQFSEETSAILAAGFFIPEHGVENVYGNDDTAWFVRGGVKVEF